MNTRRGLLHVTKIIQNLANNVRFGKEEHMVPFNDFLIAHVLPVMRFLTELSVSRTFYAFSTPSEIRSRTPLAQPKKVMIGSAEALTKQTL